MNLKMSSSSRRSAPLRPVALLMLGGLLAVPTLAQPAAPGGQFGPGQDGGQGMGRGGRGQGGRGMGGPGMGMSGPGRGDRVQMREMMLKSQLEQAGFTDAALQNSVLTFARGRDAGRQSLQAAANALSLALVDQTTTDAQIGQLLDTFTQALSVEKTRLQSAEKQLDTEVKFSTNRRLKAVLTLSGVIGDAMTYLGPPNGGRGGGPGGMGGPGGGFGGGFGGGMRGRGGPDGGMGGPPRDF
ncbi:MAG TPA: hypothetical protein VF627_03725 [Abditibacterium sp.]